MISVVGIHRGVAQFGRALRSGRRGRVFESRHPDFFKKLHSQLLLIYQSESQSVPPESQSDPESQSQSES